MVKTGDSLDIGNGKRLIFVETPMLHWPDSMMTYMTGDAVLFSNDAFGQLATASTCLMTKSIRPSCSEQCQRYCQYPDAVQPQ